MDLIPRLCPVDCRRAAGCAFLSRHFSPVNRPVL